MRTLICAGSYREAAAYARGVGLRHYRYASAAADVANFAAQRVVELPGYAKRRDHHSIDALVKRLVKRGVEHVKDSYTPPPAEVTLEDKVATADWLFAAVPTTPSATKLANGKPASRKSSKPAKPADDPFGD